MIIIRIPFRLPLGGGGTDLPAYYEQFGGQLVTASINKYMYVSINRPVTSDLIKLYYAKTEVVNSADNIEHDIIRESLKLQKVLSNIEIGSMAEIEAGTGMGSSSAFAVGLLTGLNILNKNIFSPRDIAEEACKVEIDLVGKKIGKQDQYAVALGGINELVIDRFGNVNNNRLNLSDEFIRELEERLLIFYTYSQRDANVILSEQSKKISESLITEKMHYIKEIGVAVKKALIEGEITRLGRLFDLHWQTKRELSNKMSDDTIDGLYRLARQSGAIGGKIMGAGGGGMFLFCCEPGRRKELKTVMEEAGLRYVDFRFEFDGIKVINI
jgi:D-glycero-alpha-D-manno-heptose-7-phosphate kinase